MYNLSIHCLHTFRGVWSGSTLFAQVSTIQVCQVTMLWSLFSWQGQNGSAMLLTLGKCCLIYHKKQLMGYPPSKILQSTIMNNVKRKTTYHIYSKYWDRQAWANPIDLDQIPHNMVSQNMASDQGVHCLPFIQQILDISIYPFGV